MFNYKNYLLQEENQKQLFLQKKMLVMRVWVEFKPSLK